MADFQCEHGCIDVIFCACRLIEKTVEHDTKAFLLLRKAYDSVPREAMWMTF